MKQAKVIALSMAAVLCLGSALTGCGGTETKEAEEETEEAVEEPELQKIGDSNASVEIPMTNEMGSDITGLAVKAPGEAEYPGNMMSADQIFADGETVEFYYEPVASENADGEAADDTTYFLQVTMEDGSEYELSDFDLEDMLEVTLCLKDGVAYLKYLSTSQDITINTMETELARKADQEAAQIVIDQIAAIGEVTSENREEVKAAREAYDALTDAQKAYVTNLSLLEDMEADVAAIEEEEAAQAAAEEEERAAAEAKAQAEAEAAEQEAAETEAETGFSFADIGGQEFVLSSGAGAWETHMTVYSDGTFSGGFHDSDMGAQGVTDDGVEYLGTVFRSDFTGKFSTPTKVNDYTYSTQVEYMSYETELGTEEVIDNELNAYTEPYGIGEGDEFLIYLPSTPISEVPSIALSFYPNLFEGKTTADHYILFNPDSAPFV